MLFETSNQELNEYLFERAFLNRKIRITLEHPEINDRLDAVFYWIEIFRQDNPLYLYFGLVAGGSMLAHLLWRIILNLLQLVF